MPEEEPKEIQLPKDIQESVARALLELSLYLHKQTDASHVVLDIKHISDAVQRASTTLIIGGGAGFKLNLESKKDIARKELAESNAEKLAEDAISRALAAGKKKQKEEIGRAHV